MPTPPAKLPSLLSQLDWTDALVFASFALVSTGLSAWTPLLSELLGLSAPWRVPMVLAVWLLAGGTAWGYARRSWLAYAGMLGFSVCVPIVLFLFGLPIMALWWVAVLKRALSKPQPPTPAPVPELPPRSAREWDAASAETEVFRPAVHDCEQTVLFSRGESGVLASPDPSFDAPAAPPLSTDDPSVPDQLDIACRWLLIAYSLLAGAATLGILLSGGWIGGQFFQNSVPRPGALKVLAQVSPMLLQAGVALAVAVGCLCLSWGLLSRARWTWALGLLLGLSIVGHGNLPLGGFVLFVLLRERGRKGFDIPSPSYKVWSRPQPSTKARTPGWERP